MQASEKFYRKGQQRMALTSNLKFAARRFGYGTLILGTLILTVATVAISADDGKSETIDATAMGTSTQMGRTVSVKIIIQRYSTDEERQAFDARLPERPEQGTWLTRSKRRHGVGQHRRHWQRWSAACLHQPDEDRKWTPDSLCRKPPHPNR